LDGKVAIVTGGARGIGKGMAMALLKAGACVTVTDIKKDVLDKTRADFDDFAKGRNLALVADGTKDEDAELAVKETVDAFGPVGMLINNAQTAAPDGPIQDQTVADVMVGVDSGFLASFRYMKACYPFLKETEGTVVNFASQAGLLGNVGMIGYNAAK